MTLDEQLRVIEGVARCLRGSRAYTFDYFANFRRIESHTEPLRVGTSRRALECFDAPVASAPVRIGVTGGV